MDLSPGYASPCYGAPQSWGLLALGVPRGNNPGDAGIAGEGRGGLAHITGRDAKTTRFAIPRPQTPGSFMPARHLRPHSRVTGSRARPGHTTRGDYGFVNV